jgi:hypothetical protein
LLGNLATEPSPKTPKDAESSAKVFAERPKVFAIWTFARFRKGRSLTPVQPSRYQ